MSNIYRFSMTGDTDKQLAQAIAYATNGMHDTKRKLERWAVTDKGILVLLGPSIAGDTKHLLDVSKMMVQNDPEWTAKGVKSWLETAEYPEEPDCDGSIKKGFQVTNIWNDSYINLGKNDLGHPQWVFWDLITLVIPHWTEYHK
jgi:hypothetical protein